MTALCSLPIPDHRVDFSIQPSTFRSRAHCECGWIGHWWHRADQASDEWRVHVGIEG